MKSPTFTPLTALVLKLVGLVLMLSYLIDLVMYLTAANFQNSQWVMTLATQLVDRGFIPLTGLAFLFTGFWIEATSDTVKATSQGLKLAVLWFASVLGLMFLVIVPFSVNATRLAAEDQTKKIEQQASDARTQLNAQFTAQLEQIKAQIEPGLNQIDQAIKAGQIQGAQLAQAKQQQEELQKYKADPKALEAKIAPQRDQKLKEIETQEKQLKDQTSKGALQTGMRIGLNSLLLAIVYAIIGWVGLRQMFYAQGRDR